MITENNALTCLDIYNSLRSPKDLIITLKILLTSRVVEFQREKINNC